MVSIGTAFAVMKALLSSNWLKWVGIGLAGLAVVLYVGWLKYDNAQKDVVIEQLAADKAALQTSNDALEEAKLELMAMSATKDRVLAKRDRENQKLAAEKDEFQRRLREVKRDQIVRTWADTPVPDAVRELLR